MFKLDKNVHLLILLCFALIFVVIYLYYTILDVRKLQKELVKSNDELNALKGSLSKYDAMTKEVEALKGKLGVPVISLSKDVSPGTKEHSANPIPIVQVAAVQVPTPQAQNAGASKDDDSVTTDEIRDTLDCTDDEDEDVGMTVPPPPSPSVDVDVIEKRVQDIDGNDDDDDDDIDEEGIIETILAATDKVESEQRGTITISDIQQMKYDDLREFCKKNNINTKGTKDILIKRICETLGL